MKKLGVVAALAVALMGFSRSSQAQWAVVDVGAIAQLIQQAETLKQELQTAENQLSQAQQQYQSMTGTRGMQNLLSGTNRNYLPSNWNQLSGAMSGGGGAYASLGSDVSTTVNRNAGLTPTQTSQFSANELDSLTQRRQSVALLEALARAALSNNSNR